MEDTTLDDPLDDPEQPNHVLHIAPRPPTLTSPLPVDNRPLEGNLTPPLPDAPPSPDGGSIGDVLSPDADSLIITFRAEAPEGDAGELLRQEALARSSHEQRREAERQKRRQLKELETLATTLRQHKAAWQQGALKPEVSDGAEFQSAVQRFLRLSEQFHSQKVAAARERVASPPVPTPAVGSEPDNTLFVSSISDSSSSTPRSPASAPRVGAHLHASHPRRSPPRTGPSKPLRGSSPSTRTLSAKGSAEPIGSGSCRLYAQSLESQRKREDWLDQERIRQAVDAKAAEGCTFHPAITSLAQ